MMFLPLDNDPVMANFGKYGFKAAVRKPFTIETLSGVVKEGYGKFATISGSAVRKNPPPAATAPGRS